MTEIEAKARQLARVNGASDGSYDVCKEAIALEMAEWMKERMIDKAVEWLSLNADLYGCFKPDKLNEMILNCKKAMEENL